MAVPDRKQLQVGVIGCGIAGLSVAVALSRAGHAVELFEKSQFKNEVGAAIVVGPNGTRILRRWGFDFDMAGALDYNQMRRIKADTLEVDSEETFDKEEIRKKYGDRWLLLHRADLHSELRRLVEQLNPTPKINLASSVADVDVENGTITLANGSTTRKDLVVIADGAHSGLIAKVLGHPSPVTKSPMSMYRFLQPMDRILGQEQAGQFYRDRPSGFTTFYKTEVGRPGLLLNTYPCRGGELLYVALVHPTKPKEKDLEGWDSPADYPDVMGDAHGFHEAVKSICEDARDVKVYTQMWRDPIEYFNKGKALLVGDAAHLMLPTHGQGASMAMEDAAALEVIFGSSVNDVESALETFDKLRGPRVKAVQPFSNKMMGPPDKMISHVKRYYLGSIPGPKAKTFSREYNEFFFRYDVVEEAKKLV